MDDGEFVVDKPGRCKVVFYFGAVNFKIVPVSVFRLFWEVVKPR